MRASAHASPDDIDIVSLWSSLRRSLPKLLIATIAAGLLTYVALSLMAPRFTSEAQLAIVAKSTNPFPDGRDKGATPDSVTPRMDKEAINTHVKALVSPDLVLKVADELKLRNKVEFNSALGNLDFLGGMLRLAGLAGPRPGESDEDRVLAVIYRQLEVAAAKESRFIPIRFSSSDPQLAADFANRLAETYRRSLVNDTIEETNDVVQALAPKVDQLRKELMDAEAEVERYRVQIDRTIGGQQRTPLIDQRLAELTAELSKAEAQKSDADVKWRTARELTQAGSAELLPDIQRSPLLQNLIQQRVRLERQVSELSASLLPGHPRMQQLNADLAGLKRQIGSEIQKFVQSVEKEARVAALRVDAITKQLSDLKTRVVNTSGEDARLKGIEGAAKAKRAELERLQKQLEDNKTIVVTKTVPIEARIVSPARASSVPTFPRKGPYSLLAMAATLLFGLAWTITRELISGARPASGGRGGSSRRLTGSGAGVGEPALAAAAAGAAPAAAATFAAAQPSAPSPAVRAAVPAARTPEPAPAPAPLPARPAAAELDSASDDDALADGPVQLTSPAAVAERLCARTDVESGLRTIVASDSAHLDPAPEASAIARLLAASGRQVVLVDWSLVGEASIPAKSGAPGIVELLLGQASFEEVITRMPDSEVHLIGCGRALEGDDEIAGLDSDRLNLILDALDEAYDHIVVTGHHEDVAVLFEVTQGRFDAGVVVSEPKRRTSVLDEPANAFLGFEVTDIDIVHLERRPAEKAVAAKPAAAVQPAPKAAAPAAKAVKDEKKEKQAVAATPAAPAATGIPASRMKLARGERGEALPGA